MVATAATAPAATHRPSSRRSYVSPHLQSREALLQRLRWGQSLTDVAATGTLAWTANSGQAKLNDAIAIVARAATHKQVQEQQQQQVDVAQSEHAEVPAALLTRPAIRAAAAKTAALAAATANEQQAAAGMTTAGTGIIAALGSAPAEELLAAFRESSDSSKQVQPQQLTTPQQQQPSSLRKAGRTVAFIIAQSKQLPAVSAEEAERKGPHHSEDAQKAAEIQALVTRLPSHKSFDYARERSLYGAGTTVTFGSTITLQAQHGGER
jgi:hypothetical protein